MAQSYATRHPVAEVLKGLAVDLDPGYQGFIADDLFSNPVDMSNFGQTATLLVDKQHSYLGDADLDAVRARGAKAQPIRDGDTGTVAISITDYALSHFTPSIDLFNDQLPGSAEERALRRLHKTLAIKREARAAALMMTAANWDTTSAAAVKWDAVTGQPISDLLSLQQLVRGVGGFMPNSLILPWTTLRAIAKNNEVREVLIGTGSATSTPRSLPLADDAVLAAISGITGIPRANIWVPGAQSNTANPGQTVARADIWDSTKVWMGLMGSTEYAQTKTGIRMDAIAAADFRAGSGVDVQAEDMINPNGRLQVVSELHDYRIVEDTLGYVFTGVL